MGLHFVRKRPVFVGDMDKVLDGPVFLEVETNCDCHPVHCGCYPEEYPCRDITWTSVHADFPVEPSSLEDLMQPPTALFDGPPDGAHCKTCTCER